ncbi:MAG: protein RarD [Rhodobacteraceae bacterium]|nr:protein RarD [Paracoccaceae bacterium]MAY44396.1 protein RarD [Paracoccaceae bacterium]QEW18064.1 putative chloramphenical resistance permease RarD [Marinibacterium anthonyi]
MTRPREDTPAGFAYAIGAYLSWGALPLYIKAVDHIPAAEVLAHRILWSVPIAGAVVLVTGRTRDLWIALRTPRYLAMAALTAALITINWGIYIWAVFHGRAVDTALGYYMNPLFSIVIGALVLGERLTRLQGAAVGIAAVAVAILAFGSGEVPVVALGITVSWGIYAYFKKQLPIGPNQGFLLEVLILSGPALALVWVLSARGEAHFGVSWPDSWLLMLGGPVTATPLLLYANGAKLLRLSTIGILQYISPTLIFLFAVLIFGEPVGLARAIALPMIWAALVLYSLSLIRETSANRHTPRV